MRIEYKGVLTKYFVFLPGASRKPAEFYSEVRTERAVVGAGGIEPPNGGIKIRCLTAWLRPNKHGNSLFL